MCPGQNRTLSQSGIDRVVPLPISTWGHCDLSVVLVSLSTGPLGRCLTGLSTFHQTLSVLEEWEVFPCSSRMEACVQ